MDPSVGRSRGFLVPLGELGNVELKALGEIIDTRLERSSLRQRIVMAGIDISLNLQDNKIIGWQLHLYILIEGENTLRLREAIKAAFPPEPTASIPYDFDQGECSVKLRHLSVQGHFQTSFPLHQRQWSPRTKSLPLKGPELRELLQFLDQYGVGERLVLRGIRRNGRSLVTIKKQRKAAKMSVTCRRELMEIDRKSMEQMRNCSGISEILDRWSNSTAAMHGSNTGLLRRNAESRASDAAVS